MVRKHFEHLKKPDWVTLESSVTNTDDMVNKMIEQLLARKLLVTCTMDIGSRPSTPPSQHQPGL